MISRLISALAANLEDRWITGVQNTCCKMKHLTSTSQLFKHNPKAHNATNVKFQYSIRLHGNHQESKPYFSYKRHLYGFNTELSVSPRGFAMYASAYYPGVKSDLSIFWDHHQHHRSFTLKSTDDAEISYHESGALSWGIISDKGYIGVSSTVCNVISKKKLLGRSLFTTKMKNKLA